MNLPRELNSIARRVAEKLLTAFPDQAFTIEALEQGHLQAYLDAPPGSRAGALVVLSAHDGDVWIRYAPPRAFYPIDDDDELVRIVRALLHEDALFAIIYDGEEWAETTLVTPRQRPQMKPNQVAVVVSWSGNQDATFE